jgi:hypothetical protein
MICHGTEHFTGQGGMSPKQYSMDSRDARSENFSTIDHASSTNKGFIYNAG